MNYMADNKSANPLATGVAGAIIGAAAAAAAIALSDEKNRKKAEKALLDLQKQGDKVLKEITTRAIQLKEAGEKVVSKVSEKKPKKIAAKATSKKKK